MAIYCPRCGAENPDHSQFCSLCLEVVGFEDPEMTTVEPAVDGYKTSYPSSFDGEAPPAQQEQQQEWSSQGNAFSQQVQPHAYSPPQQPQPPQQQEWSSPGDAFSQKAQPPAYSPQQQDPYAGYQAGAPYAPPVPYAGEPQATSSERSIDWEKAIFECLKIAAVAAAMSIALEILLSFVGLNAMMQGSFTLARIWLLLSLLIPVGFAGYVSGIRIQRKGWAVGLITVLFWAFLFRPLYYALLGWLLEGRFAFVAIVSAENIAFVFGLFLPLGALLGWLGEKRATTGLRL